MVLLALAKTAAHRLRKLRCTPGRSSEALPHRAPVPRVYQGRPQHRTSPQEDADTSRELRQRSRGDSQVKTVPPASSASVPLPSAPTPRSQEQQRRENRAHRLAGDAQMSSAPESLTGTERVRPPSSMAEMKA